MPITTRRMTWQHYDEYRDILIAQELTDGEWADIDSEVVDATEDEAPYIEAEQALQGRIGWADVEIESGAL